MAYVGGLRARLIRDSVFRMIRDSLDSLNWLDPAPLTHKPITMKAADVPMNEEIAPNTIALADEDTSESEYELGSNMSEHRWTFYVDFYAENDTIGLHLINDVKAILGGRMPSIGRRSPSCDIYDYTQATPPRIFTVEIEDILLDRGHDFPQPWLRYWYSCRFEVVDHYGDEIE